MNTFKTIVNGILTFINGQIIPILIILAILAFFFNLVIFLKSMDNEKDRMRFKKYSINSLLGLFVLLSFWAIVGIGTRTFFNRGAFIPQLPVSCKQDKGCTN